MDSKIEELHYLIDNSKRIGIFFHTYPDWDCLGSAFALRQLIIDNYALKSVRVLGDRKGKLFFLGLEGISTQKTLPDDFRFQGSLAIIVDTWKFDKIEKSELLKRFEKVVVIDHHNPYDASKIILNTLYINNSNYISCAEVILKIAETLNWKISSLTASFLYCGLWGDSQGFLNFNLNEECLLNASKLAKLGANIEKINQHVEKKDLIYEKFRSQLIFNGKQKNKYFYTILDKEILDTYKKRFNTETRLFYVIHSINLRGANLVAIWFKYIDRLVISISTKYREKEIKEIGFIPLRNNGFSYSFYKKFDGKEKSIEEELERISSLLF